MRFGRSVPDGFLPVFRVPTEADAKLLVVSACETNLDGDYIARELAHEQNLDNLDAFSQRLESVWDRIQQRREDK